MLLRIGSAIVVAGVIVTAYGLAVSWPPSEHRTSIFSLIGLAITVWGQVLALLGQWRQRRATRPEFSRSWWARDSW